MFMPSMLHETFLGQRPLQGTGCTVHSTLGLGALVRLVVLVHCALGALGSLVSRARAPGGTPVALYCQYVDL